MAGDTRLASRATIHPPPLHFLLAPGHASGHKVPARRAGGGRCADAHGHLGEALAGHGAGVAVVVAARGEVSLMSHGKDRRSSVAMRHAPRTSLAQITSFCPVRCARFTIQVWHVFGVMPRQTHGASLHAQTSNTNGRALVYASVALATSRSLRHCTAS